MKLEIACFNKQSARIAQHAGANRIELCSNLNVGGLTPELFEFIELRREMTIELVVMIRPRAGNFIYSDGELKQMKENIIQFKSAGADGFVFGVLTPDKRIDRERNIELLKFAHPLPCTFHRAFDAVKDKALALEEIIDCGFCTLLTSGLKATVHEGKENLMQLVEQANGRIEIMPGGGIRSNNVQHLVKDLQVNWIHSSAIVDESGLANANEIMQLKQYISKRNS